MARTRTCAAALLGVAALATPALAMDTIALTDLSFFNFERYVLNSSDISKITGKLFDFIQRLSIPPKTSL